MVLTMIIFAWCPDVQAAWDWQNIVGKGCCQGSQFNILQHCTLNIVLQVVWRLERVKRWSICSSKWYVMSLNVAMLLVL